MRLNLFVLLLIISSCTQQGVRIKKKSRVENLITYAKTLEIHDDGKSVKIHIYNPETKTSLKYILSTGNSIELEKGYVLIKTPIRSMITLSGTHIGMISKIGELDKIIGVSDKKYIYNPEILAKIASGKIKDFGGESTISFESIIQSKSELLIYSGFGQDFPHSEQLFRLGTLCIPNYDWKENHPLGKAEWIKFFGYLTGKQSEANAYFNKLVTEYNTLKSLAKTSSFLPSVFSGNLTGDVWYTPAGHSFNARLFKDAYINYIYANTKGIGSLEFSFEKILSDNTGTEYWLNPGLPTEKGIVSNNPKMNYFAALKNKKVFCYSHDINYFWEMSAIEPHHVLSDLIHILHPNLQTDKSLYFYKNIYQ